MYSEPRVGLRVCRCAEEVRQLVRGEARTANIIGVRSLTPTEDPVCFNTYIATLYFHIILADEGVNVCRKEKIGSSWAPVRWQLYCRRLYMRAYA
ncbi:hypothetical protein EVAR_78281_1 [Eumeta japonica]|uniref:Uncharacterized protein n=1 Tax=Eumeta variegata TaxID=151549 RepID=A0A4C1T5N9_EUMVA|nr:hypothetical protein EVAR_78281_1 [Eumeta japonica]